MKNIYFATVLTLLSGNIFGQQDKSLSVWYQSPVLYNAGAVATGEEDFSFFTNFRSQWLTIPEPGIGMRTNTLAAEFKIPDGFKGANNFGIGLNVLNDQTGSAKLMTTNVSIPITVSATGVQATSALGNVTAFGNSIIVLPTGVFGTGQVGDASTNAIFSVDGVFGTGAVGSVALWFDINTAQGGTWVSVNNLQT